MTRKFTAVDVSADTTHSKKYDIGIFFIGYESRSQYSVGLLDKKNFKKFLFLYPNDPSLYFESEEAFCAKFGIDIKHASFFRIIDPSSLDLAKFLFSFISKNYHESGVYVDYSSMPRYAYADILNVVDHISSSNKSSIDLVFSYYHGKYQGEAASYGVDDFYCLRGCEANATQGHESVAIIGLGFDEAAPIFLFENLEPTTTYCYYACPGASDGYDEKAIDRNRTLLELSSVRKDQVIPITLFSVSSALRALYEIASPHIEDASVTLLPFGPKPHVLASILLALSSPRISCMYVTKRKWNRTNVIATGSSTHTQIKIGHSLKSDE